ncbi:MAG: DeoR/GlpR family DNA-binding transcription regulator [Phycisphaerae bacterium]
MLAAERKQLILNSLAQNGKVLAAELSTQFHVSEDTIRRDLRELASEGLLQRVHGGALPKTHVVPRFTQRTSEALGAKSAIGAAAAALLQDHQVVIIDGGTTPREVAAHLPQTFPGTIITHSVPTMAAVLEHPSADLVMIGGQLDKFSQVAVGAQTIEAYSHIHADVCIVGLVGLHPDAGLTDQLFEEANVKRWMLAAAAKIVAVATSDKLGKVSAYQFAPATSLTHLVTDKAATEEQLEPYRAAGIQVIQA